MPLAFSWRTIAHFAIAALATLVFVLLSLAVLGGRADAIDRQLALAIHRIESPVLDEIMIAITVIGSAPMRMVAIAAMTIWLVRHDHRRTAAILAANGIVVVVIDALLKELVARPRPTLFDEI